MAVEKLLETIIDDVLQASSMSFDQWWKQSASNPFAPLAIPTSQRGQHQATEAGINAAHQLTDQAWQSRADLRQTISREAFDRLSFTAIGDAISNSPTHIPSGVPSTWTADAAFYSSVASDYTVNLDQLAKRARPDHDRHIPCHLFHLDQGVPAFSVGPVEFLPRADWIARYVTDPVQLTHVQSVESGTVSADALRTQALSHGSARELYLAWEILSFLQNFSWVATIQMNGHEPKQSHEKASVIVGLAIDAIGLRFPVEDARRLTKAGRQHLYAEARLATAPGGGILRGFSVKMPGLANRPGALAAKMVAERPFLDAAGMILQSYFDGRKVGRAPHLVERWANALYWVGEARREASDFMAVVNYGCAADGLSGAGGEASEMTAFAEAALNPKGPPTSSGALSVADAITRVYREGRNKLAHGEMFGLFEDLTETRDIGDLLLVALFHACTMELGELITKRPQVFEVPEKHAYRAFLERLKNRP